VREHIRLLKSGGLDCRLALQGRRAARPGGRGDGAAARGEELRIVTGRAVDVPPRDAIYRSDLTGGRMP